MKSDDSNKNRMILGLENLKEYGDLDGKTARKGDNLHRLFYYPAMMVPVTQSQILEIVSNNLQEDAYAIDPFMGSGTSLMSCMEFGLNLYGQDINPLSVLLVKAKVYNTSIESIRKGQKELQATLSKDNLETIDVGFNGIDKWFPKRIQKDLSRLRRAIISVSDDNVRSLFWIIMAEVIRIDSNDRTSTFKLHQRPNDEISKRNVDIITDFFSSLERGIQDIETFVHKLDTKHFLVEQKYAKNVDIRWGNTVIGIHSRKKFDVLVSSPPYGDNQTTVTYGQHSYLPLQWIPRSDLPEEISFDYLKTTQEIDSRSLGGRANKHYIKEVLPYITKKAPSLGRFLDEIPIEEKEKFLKTVSFIADFEKSLQTIVGSMKEKAIYVWTIGNRFVNQREVPNDQILIDLMNAYGIPLVFSAERSILNKKQAKRNRSSKTMEKEHILVFQK